MGVRRWLAALAVLGTVASAMLWREVPSTAATSGATGQDTTTLDDQVDLAVTVYNSDIALVRDTRNLTLPTGSFDLQFMDIAATVNPATVHFRSLTEPSRVSVLEQNWCYGAATAAVTRNKVQPERWLLRRDDGSVAGQVQAFVRRLPMHSPSTNSTYQMPASSWFRRSSTSYRATDTLAEPNRFAAAASIVVSICCA